MVRGHRSSFMYLISKGEQWSIDYMMGAYNFMRRMDIKPVIGYVSSFFLLLVDLFLVVAAWI